MRMMLLARLLPSKFQLISEIRYIWDFLLQRGRVAIRVLA